MSFQIPLWKSPKEPPHSNQESFQPYLTAYLIPGNQIRSAVIVVPGGGYHFRAAHEGENVALKFNSLGFHAFVLEYRVAPYVFPAAQEDAIRSVRLVRYHAEKWHIRPERIALLGFSAGGHLACSTGILFDKIPARNWDETDSVSARPDALGLCYPVITANVPYAHRDSFVKLLGREFSAEEAETLSLENQVRPDMPPTFLWHGGEDSFVPCDNSLLMTEALRRCHVPVELHIFRKGGHGIDLGGERCPYVQIWPELFREFFNTL